MQALRRHTQTGRPLTGEAFLAKLENQLGRRLRLLPVGRPRKEKIGYYNALMPEEAAERLRKLEIHS